MDSGGEWGEMGKFGWGDWGNGGKVEIGGVERLRWVEWGCYDANVCGRKSHFWKIPPPMAEHGNMDVWYW